MKLTFSDRINFSVIAIKKNSGIILCLLLPIFIGSGIIYIGTIVASEAIPLYIFGGSFICFSLFFFIATMPSSLLFYYENALVKKYGGYTTAIITQKNSEDHSYVDKRGNETIEEFHYILHYKFEYRNTDYDGLFYVAHEKCYNAIDIGSEIPIKYLRTDPKKSFPRRVKLSKELRIPLEYCK